MHILQCIESSQIFVQLSGLWRIGPRIAGAAELAVKQVNDDDNLLGGRVLKYSMADSGCSQKEGLAAMGKLVGTDGKDDTLAVIGPGCSTACEVTSYLSGGQEIPQISWGCTSHQLSNKNHFPLVRKAHTEPLSPSIIH